MQSVSSNKVVFGGGLVVGHLLSAMDESLLNRRNTLLLLNLLLDLRDLVLRLNIELDLLASQCSDLDQHVCGCGVVFGSGVFGASYCSSRRREKGTVVQVSSMRG
jgi:hypothetical protein